MFYIFSRRTRPRVKVRSLWSGYWWPGECWPWPWDSPVSAARPWGLDRWHVWGNYMECQLLKMVMGQKISIKTSTTPSCSRPLPAHKIKMHLVPVVPGVVYSSSSHVCFYKGCHVYISEQPSYGRFLNNPFQIIVTATHPERIFIKRKCIFVCFLNLLLLLFISAV